MDRFLDWFNIAATESSRAAVQAAWFTTVGVILAAACAAIVSLLVAQRATYINAVTVERSKWIECLRQNISTYSGITGKISARSQGSQYQNSDEFRKDQEIARALLSELILRLNPMELEAKNLIEICRKVYSASALHSPSAQELANELMIRHAQWALKAEWERVKEEASNPFGKIWHILRRRRRLRRYKAFLSADGSLHRIRAIGRGLSDVELILLRSEMDVSDI